MPFKDPEKRKEYDRKRKSDPAYKERERIRQNKRWEEQKKDPEIVEKKREANRKYYYRNRERLNKIRANREEKEKKNERQRKYYQANRDDQLAKIIKRRRKRNPTIGLHSAIASYKRGETSFDELIGRFGSALNELSNRN